MERKIELIIFLAVFILVIIVFLSVILKVPSVHFKAYSVAYSRLLSNQLNYLIYSKDNISLIYSGNFKTNEPYAFGYPSIPISVSFNYSLYKDGLMNESRFNEYFNMEIYNILYNYFEPRLNNLYNNRTINYSKNSFLDYAAGFDNDKYIDTNMYFSNASGFYLCTTKPYYVNNSISYLSYFMCGKIASQKNGLKSLVYNFSQLIPPGLGVELSKLNMTAQYNGNSSIDNLKCYDYKLSSKVNSSIVSSMSPISIAYISGNACFLNQSIPLSVKVNVVIPSQELYFNVSYSLKSFSKHVNRSYINSLPPGSKFNLIS